MTKFLSSLWILLGCLFHQTGTAMPVPSFFAPAWQAETASGRSIDYDVQDESAKPNYDYDAVLMFSTGEKKLASLATRPLIGNFVKLVAAEGRLFRSAVSGESMDAGLFDRIQSAFQRTPGRFMFSDANSEAFLGPNLLREGETLNENIIMLRQAPSTSSVYEELIHTAQLRRGMSPLNGGWIDMEIEAAQKLIRNADLYKIPAADTAATASRLLLIRLFQPDTPCRGAFQV